MPRDGSKNLIKTSELSPEQRKELGKKGGIASGKARQEKKKAKDVINLILSSQVPEHLSKTKKSMEEMGLPATEHNMQSAVIAGQAISAAKGNHNAAEWLYNMVGERSDASAVEGDGEGSYRGLPASALGKAFVDINRDIDNGNHTYYDFRGGRGSLKSSYCGLKLVDLVMRNTNYCALAARQVKDTIKDSIYSQIVWAIDELGLSEEFHCTKSPMEIKRKTTGQIIYFRGADDPMKIKSIKPPNNMYIGVLWIEEADQIRGDDAYRNILQSVMRGGNNTVVFRSYNTPISERHYINVEARKDNSARVIHHSHYTEAPKEWLGDSFYELADRLKRINPRSYEHEYDGKAVGTGLTVFENVKLREITDEELDTFEHVYYGLDFGYYPDAAHFLGMSFDYDHRKLYIYEEIRGLKLRNEDLASKLNDWRTVRIVADSAEPKSIADFASWGFDMHGAKKGPGSLEYSMKWLQSLTEIIIDNKRCPYAADEFVSYEYQTDKDGNAMSAYSGEGDHSIAAARYGMSDVWRVRGQ